MHSNEVPHNPNALKRLICIFPHLKMNLKIFGTPARKDPNNIVIEAQLIPSGGSEKNIALILDTIDTTIAGLLEKVGAGVQPQIYELILIVEGNGGNTGIGISIMEDLISELQKRCPYFKIARSKEEVGVIYREGKIPLLCYTLGTGVTHVAEGEKPQSCDQIRTDWNASFLNSKTSTLHSVIGQYLSKKSLEEVMEMMEETSVIPFPLSILSPSSSNHHFSFSPISASSTSSTSSQHYPAYPLNRQTSGPESSSTSYVMSPLSQETTPRNDANSPIAPPSTPEPTDEAITQSKKPHLSIITSNMQNIKSKKATTPDPEFDIGSVPIQNSPFSERNTLFNNSSEANTPAPIADKKNNENLTPKK